MSNETGAFIKERRIALGLTQSDVARACNVSKSTVSLWESGGISDMRRDRIQALANVLQVNPVVLVTDTRNASSLPPELSIPSYQRVPLIGSIACGTPILAQENIEDYVNLLDNTKCDFALRCKGDSMAPRVTDGDIVLIRQQPDVEDGQIAAVLIDGEATLKHVYHLPNNLGLQLIAENPAYQPIIATSDNSESLQIIGRAVAFQRAL